MTDDLEILQEVLKFRRPILRSMLYLYLYFKEYVVFVSSANDLVVNVFDYVHKLENFI